MLFTSTGDAGCLSAYLSFENVYNSIVYDESHNGNAGTMHGCARVVNNGKFGRGLQLSEDGNVTFDVERFHNRPTEAITVSLWLNLSQVNVSNELFFTCGTPELYNMGDYRFAVDNGKVQWLEELPGGSTRFNVSSSKQTFILFYLFNLPWYTDQTQALAVVTFYFYILRDSVWENQAKLKNLGRRKSADLNHISVGYCPYPTRNHDNIFPIGFLVFESRPPPKNCPSGVVKVKILSEIQLWITFEAKPLRTLFYIHAIFELCSLK